MKNYTITMCDLGFGANSLGVLCGYETIKALKPNLTNKIEYLDYQIKAYDAATAKARYYDIVYDACLKLYDKTLAVIKDNKIPITLGGDHSLALGSVKANLKQYSNDLGLVWIDAHADINTFEHSASKNIHGTPVASLLALNDEKYNSLGNDLILDKNKLVYFATRSVDYFEQGTIFAQAIYEIKDAYIKATSFEIQLQNLILNLKNQTDKIHISLDLDSMDPSIIKGVSTPVKHGLTPQQVLTMFQELNANFEIVGIDIFEYNPLFDDNHATINFIEELINLIATF